MMKRNIVVITILSGMYVFADTARLGVCVIDEVSSTPVEGCEVWGRFDRNDNPWLLVKGEKSPLIVKAYTDRDGYCKVEGKTPTGKVWVSVEKASPGYYEPYIGGELISNEKSFFGTWQPDDLVITMCLQRVEHPIPLYVNKTTSAYGDASSLDVFTGHDERARYDLLKGDWLPPVGTGEVADVEFVRLPHVDLGELTRSDGIRGRMYRDSMEVRFLGEHNGLMEMPTESRHLVKIKQAPEDGYVKKWVVSKWRDEKLKIRESWTPARFFCFRIRAKTDADGKLVDGFYGKIYGDIAFQQVMWKDIPIGCVKMQYYLNLTSLDRNLEWDGKNLCKEPRRLFNHGL